MTAVGRIVRRLFSACRGSRSPSNPTAEGRPRLEFSETLFVVPCSAKKTWNRRARRSDGTSVLDSLPPPLANELHRQRIKNALKAKVDESSLLPAAARYTGYLYQAAGNAFDTLLGSGSEVLIISSGYGVVHAREPIGMYEQAVLEEAMWPNRLVQRCLAAHATHAGAKTVIGLLSRTTEYAQWFREVHWPQAIEEVYLVSPVARSRSGAQIAVPRATGEALAAIARRQRLSPDWTSSDGLHVRVTPLRSR